MHKAKFVWFRQDKHKIN